MVKNNIMNLDNLDSKEFFPGLKGKLIHGEKISWAFWEVKKGSIVPEHSHIHEQIMYVEKGEFEFTLNGVTKIYSTGDIVHVPSNCKHSGKALTSCFLMDVFSPTRNEYK